MQSRSLVLVICFVTAAVAFAALAWFTPVGARGALPSTATEIREHVERSDGLMADAAYQLKARITHREFMQFAERMGLRPVKAGQDAKFWSNAGSESWWDATSGNDGAYVRIRSASTLERAKYENGFLYYIDSTGY